MVERNIQKEKKKMFYWIFAGVHYCMISITIGYYILAKNILGINLYVSSILAGLSGGMWSLGESKVFDFYQKTKKKDEPWMTKDSFDFHLHRWSNINLIFFSLLVIEIIIIWVFNL